MGWKPVRCPGRELYGFLQEFFLRSGYIVSLWEWFKGILRAGFSGQKVKWMAAFFYKTFSKEMHAAWK